MAAITTSKAISPRLGLALAAAVTGVLLAGGVTLASLLGWLQPGQVGSASASANVQDDPPPQLMAAASLDTSAPQVVPVPAVPATVSAAQSSGASDAGFTRPQDRDKHDTPKLSRESEHSAIRSFAVAGRDNHDDD